MRTTHDAAIAIRDNRFRDAAAIFQGLADHASILRKRSKVDHYTKLAKENLDIALGIETGMSHARLE